MVLKVIYKVCTEIFGNIYYIFKSQTKYDFIHRLVDFYYSERSHEIGTVNQIFIRFPSPLKVLFIVLFTEKNTFFLFDAAERNKNKIDN